MSESVARQLRSAAEEPLNRRYCRALSDLAQRLESGRDIHEVLQEDDTGLPQAIKGAVACGLACHDLPRVLVEITDRQTELADLVRTIKASLAYPLLLFTIVAIVSILIAVFVIPSLADVAEMTELDIGSPGRLSWQAYAISGAAAGAALVGLRIVGGAANWRWLISTFPVVGPIFLWLGTLELVGLLQILLKRNVPLDRALLLAGSATKDANVAHVAASLSRDVAAGAVLSDRIAVQIRLPASLAPVIRWGEEQQAMDEAMGLAADNYAAQLRLRADWITSVLSPLTILVAAGLIMGLLVNLIVPLITFIRLLA